MRITKTKPEDRCIATNKLNGKQCSIKARKNLNQSLCTNHLKEIGFDFEFAKRELVEEIRK